jgi:glycosyltransferase involved in cell wall biosynthesis
VVWIRGEAEYRLADSAFHRWLSPRVWSDAAGVLVQSDANRVALLAELERAAPARAAGVRAKLAVVGNGLELPPVTPLPEALRVLCVGRLIADKGVDVVIDACARERLPLTVAGDGPERAALEQRARARGVEAASPAISSARRWSRSYREAGVVVLAARRGEGLPNVLLEAMAHARPVIATPCAGTRDLLADGVNGLSVPPGDEAALASALGALRAGRSLATRLAAAARTTAEAHEWSRVEPRLEAALERWRRR